MLGVETGTAYRTAAARQDDLDNNTFEQAGARRLKKMIEDYWAHRGYSVKITLIEQGFNSIVRSGRFDVRSDMRNGMPTKRISQSA